MGDIGLFFMKRFTETEKWRDPWFLSLDQKSRVLWIWLCDRVDNSGVIDIHWPSAAFETGYKLSEKDVHSLGSRIEKLENGKYYIPSFVGFQFGELSSNSKVHQSIMKLMKKHSLCLPYE